MDFISDAINAGVEEGAALGGELGFAKICDGYDEPQERCPLTPAQGGCICLRVRARLMPRWRRLFMSRPDPPISFSASSALVVEYIATDGMMAIPKRNVRSG